MVQINKINEKNMNLKVASAKDKLRDRFYTVHIKMLDVARMNMDQTY